MPTLKVISLSAFLALLLVSGCAFNGSQPTQTAKLQPASAPTPAVEVHARSVLQTSIPALADYQSGSEFDFRLSVELASPLFQGCGRVVYDPRQVEPISVGKGALLPTSYIFIAPLVSRSESQSSLPAGLAAVPFAFTGTPGEVPIQPQTGELLHIRFRVKQPIVESQPVYLLNSFEYLQLRDESGTRLAFDLSTQEVQQ